MMAVHRWLRERRPAPRALPTLAAVLVAVGISLTASASAFAASPASGTTLPDLSDLHPTCAAGQPRLDYEYGSNRWANVCGFATWRWAAGDKLVKLRMVTTPAYQIEEHQTYPDKGKAECLMAPDVDTTPPMETPGAIQVSENALPCDMATGNPPAVVQTILKLAEQAVGAPYSSSVSNHDAGYKDTLSELKANGTDCSGFISYLMGLHGAGLWTKQSYGTSTMIHAPDIQTGANPWLTIYNNPSPGSAGHVFIEIEGQYFDDHAGGGVTHMTAALVQSYLSTGEYTQIFHLTSTDSSAATVKSSTPSTPPAQSNPQTSTSTGTQMCVDNPATKKQYCLSAVAASAPIASAAVFDSGSGGHFTFSPVSGTSSTDEVEYIKNGSDCLQLDKSAGDLVRWASCNGDLAEQWYSELMTSNRSTTSRYLISSQWLANPPNGTAPSVQCLSLDLDDGDSLRADPCDQDHYQGTQSNNWYQAFGTN